MTRVILNMNGAELDTLARIADARRELEEIANALFFTRKGSKASEREAFGRRLDGVRASLRTVEQHLRGEEQR